MRAVSAVWSDFVASLRRGDYPNAHALFSAESRTAMPYPEFVAEYGPLTLAREMVLVKPDSQSTRFDEDWAELTFGGVNPGTGRRFKVGVSLTRNNGQWGLVAARNETGERAEAQARGLLRAMAAWRGVPEARQRLDAIIQANADNPLFRLYRFESKGEDFRAMPLKKGLRAFFVDERGNAQSMTDASPAAPDVRVPYPTASTARPAATPPLPELNEPVIVVPPAPAAPPLVDGLPELSEPPSFSPFADAPGEMSEPPSPDVRRRSVPDRVDLPDSIQ